MRISDQATDAIVVSRFFFALIFFLDDCAFLLPLTVPDSEEEGKAIDRQKKPQKLPLNKIYHLNFVRGQH